MASVHMYMQLAVEILGVFAGLVAVVAASRWGTNQTVQKANGVLAYLERLAMIAVQAMDQLEKVTLLGTGKKIDGSVLKSRATLQVTDGLKALEDGKLVTQPTIDAAIEMAVRQLNYLKPLTLVVGDTTEDSEPVSPPPPAAASRKKPTPTK